MRATAQPAPETDEKKSRGLGSYVVWAFVAVMVYVLSIGPVFRLYLRGKLNPKIVVIYKPLVWACSGNVLSKPLARYMEFWCPETAEAPLWP